MGKKKTKTAKQKQNAAAKKLARSFEKKLGVSAEAKRAVVTALDPETSNNKSSHNNINNHNIKPTVARKKQATKLARKKQSHSKSILVKQKIANDVMAFAKEHASVQERGEIMEWKRNQNNNNKTRKGKTKKQQQQQHQLLLQSQNDSNPQSGHMITNTTTSTRAPLQFAQPTFAFLDSQKTTDQLIQETTNRVQNTGLFGTAKGSSSQGGGSNNPVLFTSATTTAPSLRWEGLKLPQQSNGPTMNSSSNNNPFQVLQEEEEDETTDRKSVV